MTATTNHTIAVNPSQIPYGSKVVINGQVYVAEAVSYTHLDVYKRQHISWAPKESRKRLMDIAVNNLEEFLKGSPVNVFNK